MQITVDLLRAFAGKKARADIIAGIADHAADVLPRYGITSALRLQHFFAQVAHECGGFTIREENMNYSVKRLQEVWPKRFPSAAAAAPYANNPEKLGNYTYGSRMGNGPPSSGDGFRYRGRSLAQHTGKDGYRAIEKITGLPLVQNPDLVNDPAHALECAAAYWKWKKLAAPADRDDVVAVTKLWNGGTIGLADRKAWLLRARKFFTAPLSSSDVVGILDADEGRAPVEPSAPTDDAPDPSPVAVGGAVTGDPELWSVQRRLDSMNYNPGDLDGVWGGMTAGAISGFLNDRGSSLLAPTSLETFSAIHDDLKAELGRAEMGGYRRPVSAARASGDIAVVAKAAPEVVPVHRNFLATAWAAVVAFFTAIYNAVSDKIGQAWDFFTDHRDDIPSDSGFLHTVWGYLGKVPTTVWLLLAAAGLGFLALNSFNGVKKISDAVKTGERQ